VIEEKASRIVEVIASSARPYELMMGKVLGIGAAGLTQFAVWAVLVAVAFAFVGPMLLLITSPELAAAPGTDAALEAAGLAGFQLPPVSLFLSFILYFIGGYLLYASLFAAVGSAVETEADAQSLQMPITIPVILPALFLPFIADNPEAPLAVALSLVPFFSPILMPVRIAGGATAPWEVVASLVLLVAAFLGAIWLAARIYRVGILMYGKKASFRDLIRWVRYA
jgi:ABC-2 type transport system permease protein